MSWCMTRHVLVFRVAKGVAIGRENGWESRDVVINGVYLRMSALLRNLKTKKTYICIWLNIIFFVFSNTYSNWGLVYQTLGWWPIELWFFYLCQGTRPGLLFIKGLKITSIVFHVYKAIFHCSQLHVVHTYAPHALSLCPYSYTTENITQFYQCFPRKLFSSIGTQAFLNIM